MLEVEQYLGENSQTLVQGDLADGKVRVKTVVPTTGGEPKDVLIRIFDVTPCEAKVSYAVGAGVLKHRVRGAITLDALKELLSKLGVALV